MAGHDAKDDELTTLMIDVDKVDLNGPASPTRFSDKASALRDAIERRFNIKFAVSVLPTWPSEGALRSFLIKLATISPPQEVDLQGILGLLRGKPGLLTPIQLVKAGDMVQEWGELYPWFTFRAEEEATHANLAMTIDATTEVQDFIKALQQYHRAYNLFHALKCRHLSTTCSPADVDILLDRLEAPKLLTQLQHRDLRNVQFVFRRGKQGLMLDAIAPEIAIALSPDFGTHFLIPFVEQLLESHAAAPTSLNSAQAFSPSSSSSAAAASSSSSPPPLAAVQSTPFTTV